MNILRNSALTILLFIISAQASDYLITWIAPPTKVDTSVCVRIDFMKTGITPDDSFTIYYGSQAGGGVPANYPSKASIVFRIGNTPLSDSAINYKSVTLPAELRKSYTKPDSTSPTMRSIYFAPRHQNMTAGRYYFIIKGNQNGVSQEAQVIIETKEAAPLISPKGEITSMQPVFSWSQVQGVPYYHLLLSDQTIKLDQGSISNASFIWQAIVPGSEIQYGSPDPSGIFPPPPPLSPGTKYQWLVLNNYGNQKEYTSTNALPIPAEFSIAGDSSLSGLKAPDTSTMKTIGDNITLATRYDSLGKIKGDTFNIVNASNGQLTLSWGKINHKDANLYRVYLYNIVYDSNTKSDAAIVVWTRSTNDTFVKIDAKSFLASPVLHVWKVFVENTSGAGVASGRKAFFYNDKSDKARISYRSYERVGTNDSAVIKFANVTITPLAGGGMPIDIPTDQNGYGSKSVPLGSYRVLMNPTGYKEESRDVTVTKDTSLTFVLSPYAAQLYGNVTDSGIPVGDATIEAVSATGDTLNVNTDASGSFSIRVDAGNWQITVSKLGYRRSNPESYTLTNGQSKSTGALNISMYTNLINGTVRNLINNTPIINAIVTLKRNGVVVGEKRSSDVGSYSFAVEAGTGYEVIVERQGFSTTSRSNITLTTNVVYDAYLSSLTGSIAGATFVTSNMITSTTSTYITNGRQGIVITAIDSTGDTVATTESNRGDNTFLLTLVPGRYKLLCSGEGVIPDSISNVTVREDSTTTLNITLHEYGRILGRVYAKNSGVNGIVEITARHSSGVVMSAQTAQSNGDYTLTGLIPGSWTLTFAKNGFVSKTASRTIVDTTLSGGVKALTSRYIAPDSLNQGTLSLSFTMSILDSTISSDSLQTIRIISPSAMNIPFGTSLSQVGAGNYVFGTSVTDKKVLSIDSLGKTVSANGSVALVHPFWHVTKTVADTSRDSITLKLFIKGTTYSAIETSAKLFYRDQASNTWNYVLRKQKVNDTLIFKLLPTSDNSNMIYYFEVKARAGSDTVKWSNRLSSYSTFIPPRSGIKYMMLFPTAWDAATPASIPWKTSTDFTVFCQNGAFKSTKPDSVLWIPRSRTGIITFKGLKDTIMTATVTGDTSINEAAVDTLLCKIYFAGRDTTIKTYYRIAKQKIDKLIITSSSKSISAGQKANFLVAGVNIETGRLFPATGSWATLSTFNEPYGISSMGEFTAPSNYIGTVKIRAEAFGKRAFFDLPVKHLIKAGDTSYAFDALNVSDASIVLGFGSNVYPTGTGRDLSLLTTPQAELPVLKAITSVGEVISSTYMLTLGISPSELPSSVFTVMIKIPDASKDKQVFPAVWDQKKTAWIPLENHKVVYLDADKRYLGKAEAKMAPAGAVYAQLLLQYLGLLSENGLSGEYALLNEAEEFGIKELKIGPNPFSPLIYAVDSVGNKWQGLRVEFLVSSDATAQTYSEVQILNMEGNIINSKLMTHEETVNEFKELYSLNTMGGFFGKRTLKRVYFWNGTNNSGRLCRNGRYLVRIRAADATKTQYKTIPVTLFK